MMPTVMSFIATLLQSAVDGRATSMVRESAHDRHEPAHGPPTVLLCTDGSDLALAAIRQGLALLATPGRIVSADGGAAGRPDARDRDGVRRRRDVVRREERTGRGAARRTRRSRSTRRSPYSVSPTSRHW